MRHRNSFKDSQAGGDEPWWSGNASLTCSSATPQPMRAAPSTRDGLAKSTLIIATTATLAARDAVRVRLGVCRRAAGLVELDTSTPCRSCATTLNRADAERPAHDSRLLHWQLLRGACCATVILACVQRGKIRGRNCCYILHMGMYQLEGPACSQQQPNFMYLMHRYKL